jgi:hypothetical protein
LHAHLRKQLGDLLGEDPERKQTGGPVYVRSEAQAEGDDRATQAGGLARVVDSTWALAREGKIAHVALVYSPSEPVKPRMGSVAEAMARALLEHNHYISALGALRLVLGDAWAAVHEKQPVEEHSTLRPRADLPADHHTNLVARALFGHRAQEAQPAASAGAFGIVHALEDDVATYVARNDLRERVRGFVQEALVALLGRPDVSSVIVNAHSQGTVICWDVLCRLPFSGWQRSTDRWDRKLRCLVTAGSPIRKYVDMFEWGEQVGQMSAMVNHDPSDFSWQNFYDKHDPVADPLNPARAWRPGQPLDAGETGDDGLLVAVSPSDGLRRHVHVTDIPVNNIEHSSGGGLQAHDYWNNERDYVPKLAALLKAARVSD